MRTTLDIDDRLLIRAKTAAVRRRTRLTRLSEEGLRHCLKKPATRPFGPFKPLPVFKGGSGFRPGIDPLSNRSIYEAADDDVA